MLYKAGGRGLAPGLQARGDLGGGGRGEEKPVLRNQLWQKQVKLAAMVSLRQTKCQLAFNLKLQQVEMWWTVHLEGGPRRVNHAAVAMGERVFSFGDH